MIACCTVYRCSIYTSEEKVTLISPQNSIRHNLSLHQRFLKVQNEGAGKSSWWTINPERKLGSKPRRRATSGDVRSVQVRRDRARRRRDALPSLPLPEPLHHTYFTKYRSLAQKSPLSEGVREPVTTRLQGLSLGQEDQRLGTNQKIKVQKWNIQH